MKNSLVLLIVSAAFFGSCSNSKKDETNTDQLMFQLDSTDNHTGIQRMQVSTNNEKINVNGKTYSLYINRAPSDSLPAVKCESGLFNDNKIEVRITNPSSYSNVFTKTFTKTTFAEYLSDDFKKNAILEGIVFDAEKSEASKTIVLAASVSIPLSDLYIPFTIKIADGSISSISKDDEIDEPPADDNN